MSWGRQKSLHIVSRRMLRSEGDKNPNPMAVSYMIEDSVVNTDSVPRIDRISATNSSFEGG